MNLYYLFYSKNKIESNRNGGNNNDCNQKQNNNEPNTYWIIYKTLKKKLRK